MMNKNYSSFINVFNDDDKEFLIKFFAFIIYKTDILIKNDKQIFDNEIKQYISKKKMIIFDNTSKIKL